MYFLFRFHNITPSKYKNMEQGEKKIIKQFMYEELDDLAKENNVGGGN